MPEMDFDPRKVAFALITSYPKWYKGSLRSIKHTHKVRGDLALEFVRKAAELGCHVVVSDGKSAKTFRKELQGVVGAKIILRKTSSSGDGKRIAIDKASTIDGVEVIALSEPEKVSLLNSLKQIVEPIFKDKADMVIPKREDALFKSTHPRYMYESEIEGNSIYNEALRANGLLPKELFDLDTFFGPRVIRNTKVLTSLFKRKYHFSGISLLEKLYSPEQYSNAQFFPIINALKKKVRVAIIEIPFVYPRLQKENEDVGLRDEFIAKRSLQRVSILIDLMHFLSFLQKNKSSRVRVLQ